MITFYQDYRNELVFVIDTSIHSFNFPKVRIDKHEDISENKEPYFDVFVSDEESKKTIWEYELQAFPPLYVLRFTVNLSFVYLIQTELFSTVWFISDESSKPNHEKTFRILLDFSYDLSNWKGNYSLAEYYSELERLISQNDRLIIQMNDKSGGLGYGFCIELKEKVPTDSKLRNEIENIITIFKDLNSRIEEKVVQISSLNQISIKFDFPEEIKTNCEQYLLYFATFLRDLGIKTTSNLKEEAGKVLFSVTPTDDIEALDKIREALAVYLNLPSSPVLYNDSFQSMQLKQQVENLQHSQRMKEMEMRSAQYALRLAQQNIENQDKIITRQNSFIDNQNKVIEKITSKSIMIDSLENKEELEKFCEGFEVGKSEFLIKHFGLHLNPATVLKNVGKKILGKEEERISILDSDEETDKK